MGIFYNDTSVFKDVSILKKYPADQADWNGKDFMNFHKDLLNYYYSVRRFTKDNALAKANAIVKTDYNNLNFYSKPGLDCEVANYFARYGFGKDFLTKVVCAGSDIVDSAGTIIESVGASSKSVANTVKNVTETISNTRNWSGFGLLAIVTYLIYKENKTKNGRKTR